MWRGAGYAGGIISAALMEKKCALMIGKVYIKKRFNFI
jgi:uncharacterized FAD-dependent dehydrogenase